MANTISFSSNARVHNQVRKYLIFALAALVMCFLLLLILTRKLIFLPAVIVLPIIAFLIIMFTEEKKLSAGGMLAQASNKTLDKAARVARFFSPRLANNIAGQKSLPTVTNRMRSGTQGITSRVRAAAGIGTQSSWFS